MKKIALIISAFSCLFMAGCTETQFLASIFKDDNTPQTIGKFKIGRPYNVDGTTYYPRETYEYEETGIASWYGPGFHGKQTASGEKFNTGELTGAHRTLQLPSLVRVTNLENGKSLIVRINDRGPFSRGRIIDVSKRAAELLGFIGKGTAQVKLQVLSEESKIIAQRAKQGVDTSGIEVALNQGQKISGHTTAGVFYPDPIVSQVPVHPTALYVQTGAFSIQANAQNQAQQLEAFGRVHVLEFTSQTGKFYRVRVGPVPNVAEADALLNKLLSRGFPQAITVVDAPML